PPTKRSDEAVPAPLNAPCLIFIIREKGIAQYRRTCYQKHIADHTFTMQRCLEFLPNKFLRSFLRPFADGIAQMASFWCRSVLVCFLCCWNSIAQEQDPLAQLRQQCDQLERNSKWSEAVAVAEKILTLTKGKNGEQHAETVEAMHTLARMLNNNEARSRAEQVWQKTLALEEMLFGKESPQAARSLRMLGNVTSSKG